MRVVWSLGAQEDAREIVALLLEQSEAAARRVAQEFAIAAERLSDFPLLGMEADAASRRFLLVARGRYRLIYRVEGELLRILGISLAPKPWSSERF